MAIKLHSRTRTSATIETPETLLRFTAITANIIRLTEVVGRDFPPEDSLMIVPSLSTSEIEVEEFDTKLVVSAGSVCASVDIESAHIIWSDTHGGDLLCEGNDGRKMKPVDVVLSVFDEDTVVSERESIDGVAGDVSNIKTKIDRHAYAIDLHFDFVNGEAIYGFGSHEEGELNYRGRIQYLYQQNMKAVVPAMVSTRGYGILFDNYSAMVFDDTGKSAKLSMRYGKCIDYYFVYGPELDTIVRGFRHLTGKAEPLPLWAFGYIQSKERYVSAEELIETVKEFRQRSIPIDCIVLDWRSWVGELWGDKNLDPDRFPDPADMMSKIHDLDAKLMISIWPHMRGEGRNRIEMMEHQKLLGNETTYNAFDSEAREMYWKQANEGLFKYGIDSWWCDCTEPFEADWRGEEKLTRLKRMKINTDALETYLDPEYANAFSLLHSKGIWEGQRKVSDKRVVNLTRSSFAGQQRYGTITWSGDIAARWEVLKGQIADGLNFNASGQPFWTTDIGAFFVKPGKQWFWDGEYPDGCDDKGYRELYVRWLQFGTFLPMFRSHGTDTPREPWRFGKDGELIYETIKKYINLRYRLIQYIYSCARMVFQDGYTIMRPLVFDHRADHSTYDISDQYMFGPFIMVCPVTSPMYFEAGSKALSGESEEREVYLPEGKRWYDFWTGATFAGGQSIVAAAPLETIPLFIPEGSILALNPAPTSTNVIDKASLELRIYPGADGRFTLYADEGDGYGYIENLFAEIDIAWHDEKNTITVSERRGTYEGAPAEITMAITIVGANHGVGDKEYQPADRTIIYKGQELSVELR